MNLKQFILKLKYRKMYKTKKDYAKEQYEEGRKDRYEEND